MYRLTLPQEIAERLSEIADYVRQQLRTRIPAPNLQVLPISGSSHPATVAIMGQHPQLLDHLDWVIVQLKRLFR